MTMLSGALRDEGADPSWCRATIDTAAHGLLDRAQRGGTVRADITVRQLLGLGNALAFAVGSGQDAETEADRLTTVVVDGLRRV